MDLSPPITRTALRAAGYSDREVRRMRTSGALTAVRRGAYFRGRPPEEAAQRHLVAARAALDQLSGSAVCSHATAAVLHGLPVWRLPLGRVQVTRVGKARRSGSRVTTRVHVHAAPLPAQEVETVAGMPVTTLARTAVDLARSLPFEEAVALLDAVLHGADTRPADTVRRPAGSGGTAVVPADHVDGLPPSDPLAPPARRAPLAHTELTAALRRAAGWQGAPAARRAVAFADGRSASVGESRSRVALNRAGLPTPVLQWDAVDITGRRIGLVDFGWPEPRTVGEFDGQVKYGRLLRPGQDPGEVVFAEKVREDRLRDQGYAVVRWTWSDLDDFAPIADRLRHRLHR